MEIVGVVLAAGLSSRAGGFKMTRRLAGKPMIEHVIGAMSFTCKRIVVVTGNRKERLSYLTDRYQNVSLAFNENYTGGMFGSVLRGLFDFKGDAAFICPGDCPAIRPDTYQKLAEGNHPVSVPFYRGIPGHPVFIRGDFVTRLKAGHFTSLREFINACGCNAVETNDPAILMDADYPKDFLLIERYMRGL
jgi:molybdenum cofactor cytidylyltransferase